MAIRIRKVSGKTIALCAAETDKKSGDLYLDDTIHHALATKFGLDWHKEGFLEKSLADEILVKLMEKERVREAWSQKPITKNQFKNKQKENELYEELKRCDEFTKNGILHFLRVNR